jgi:hypothetical protein
MSIGSRRRKGSSVGPADMEHFTHPGASSTAGGSNEVQPAAARLGVASGLSLSVGCGQGRDEEHGNSKN